VCPVMEAEWLSFDAPLPEEFHICTEGNPSEREHDAEVGEEMDLLCPVSLASLNFLRRGLVLWRSAPHDSRHVGILQMQAIADAYGGWLIGESKLVELRH